MIAVVPITIYETQLLKPGESTTAEVYLPSKFDSWEIRLHFCRYAYWDRIRSSAGKLGSVTLERWVARVAPYPEISFITLGPITNQPPTGNPLNR